MTAADGHVVSTTKLVDHGSELARWDLVILGEGYRQSELDTFHQDVENFLTEFRATPPFDELFCGINVHRVDIVSTDSGADTPTVAGDCGSPLTNPKTFLDARFCTPFAGVPMERLLTVDSARALQVAGAQVPNFNQALVIVNSSKYGGSGGAVATCSTEATSAKIAIHEIGHSAFGLADEYGGDGSATPAGEFGEPNVTRNTDRATNKWGDLIAAATPMPSACNGGCASSGCVPPPAPPAAGAVGTYEGGKYADCDTYRPLPSCYMRDYAPFCPVCSRVIRQTLQPFQPAESINLVTPSIEFLNVPAGMGGVGVTTHRAVVFEVVTCRKLHFEIVAGPTGGFGTPAGTSIEVTAHPILPASHGRLWLSYTSTNPGDAASGTVTVRCSETGQQWVVTIDANTVSRPRAAVSLVLDRSYSMTEDAGDAVPKIQKLREACDAFVGLLRPVDGVGVVRFNHVAQRIMEVTDGGGASATALIASSDLDPAGNTSIGDGVVNGRDMLTDAQAAAVTPYDVQAMVVLTDGRWNTPPSLASIGGSITSSTYAVGLGLPSNISVPALNTLCQNHDGFLLVTGAISADQSMRLSKYFLQVLAGVTNADVAADPGGVLTGETEHRIPFWMSEADFGMDLILLSPQPKAIRFRLEAPDGAIIDPGSGPGGANSTFETGSYASFYRCALPVLPSAAEGSHGGLWHALVSLDRKPTRSRPAHSTPGDSTRHSSAAVGLRYEFVAHCHSCLSFTARLVQTGYDIGATARVEATLTEYGVPVGSRAAGWVEVRRPDGEVDYAGMTLNAAQRFEVELPLTEPGVYGCRVRVRGETLRGSRFERERTLTASAVLGGDIWDPEGPRPNPFCELLGCLSRQGGLGDRLPELAKRYGIDLDAAIRCLSRACRPAGNEDPKLDGR